MNCKSSYPLQWPLLSEAPRMASFIKDVFDASCSGTQAASSYERAPAPPDTENLLQTDSTSFGQTTLAKNIATTPSEATDKRGASFDPEAVQFLKDAIFDYFRLVQLLLQALPSGIAAFQTELQIPFTFFYSFSKFILIPFMLSYFII